MDSTLSSLSAPSSDAWDALKKAARKYESQAYTKLADYSRLAQSVSSATTAALSSHSAHLSSQSTSLLASSPAPTAANILSAAAPAEALEADISDLLSRLSSTADEMARVIGLEPSSAASSTNGYTLQRYRAILHDYSNEFRKTREHLAAARQRAELLLPASSPTAAASHGSPSSSSLRPRSEQLIREKSSLHVSLRMTDELLQQASEGREALLSQSSMFQAMRGRLSGVRAKFPVVNSLMGRIERQRKKDVIVIAAVLATCIIFTFLYIASKGS